MAKQRSQLSHLKEALKNLAKPNHLLMPQWLSAGWSGEMAVVQSLPN
jgi:hypothetical protein